MPGFIDLAGQTYGRLLVIDRAPNRGTRVAWNCQCQCGTLVTVQASKLRYGHTQSCGCLQRERSSSCNLKHGHSNYPNGGRGSKEYNTWGLMLRRCRKETCADFPLYGGRGINVCDRWDSFENFLADMGPAPTPNHSIDRLDVNADYSPENCRWATAKEQGRNKRTNVFLELDGKRLTLAGWAEETGLPLKRIHARLKRGWSVERTLLTPTHR